MPIAQWHCSRPTWHSEKKATWFISWLNALSLENAHTKIYWKRIWSICGHQFTPAISPLLWALLSLAPTMENSLLRGLLRWLWDKSWINLRFLPEKQQVRLEVQLFHLLSMFGISSMEPELTSTCLALLIFMKKQRLIIIRNGKKPLQQSILLTITIQTKLKKSNTCTPRWFRTN